MGEERQRVVLYGDSLLLMGVQASLGASTGLEVILLDESLPDLMKLLDDLYPDAVIFDLDIVSPDFPLAILKQPGPLLIGVNPSSNELLVLSSHPVQALSVADLVSIISRKGTTRPGALTRNGLRPSNYSQYRHPRHSRR